MIDLTKETVSIDCPVCSKSLKVKIGQIIKSDEVKCKCGQSIQLHDEGGSFKRGQKKINDSIKSLQNTLRQLSK